MLTVEFQNSLMFHCFDIKFISLHGFVLVCYRHQFLNHETEFVLFLAMLENSILPMN